MHLEGQYDRGRADAGYAMAVLLAAMAIMAVGWTLLVPIWKQQVQREKEAELIWRAGQYARAVAMYQRKYANAFPPTVDVLLKEKFLRKQYKDPITKGDFRLLSPLELQAIPGMTAATPGFSNRPGLPGAAGRPGTGGGQPTSSFGQPTSSFGQPTSSFGQPTSSFGQPTSSFGQQPGAPPMGTVPPERQPGLSGGPSSGPTGGPGGGIAAAVSRSSATSIRIFKNRRQYNQWVVTVEDVMPRRGLGIQPDQQPGQQPGAQPGARPGFGAPGLSPSGTPGMPTRPTP